MKLVIISVRIRCRPYCEMRLTGATISPVAGWATVTFSVLNIQERRITKPASMPNRLAGCGRVFPTRSTPARN